MCVIFCCYLLVIIIAAKGRTSAVPLGMSDQQRLTEAENYLRQYGYLPDLPTTTPEPELFQILTSVNMTDALRLFQAFVGLEQTGELDNNTIALMESPRCGFKDFDPTEDGEVLNYNTGTVTWQKNHLTYFIKDYSIKINDEELKEIIAASFQLWADVTPLSFSEVESQSDADIVLIFEGGKHGDNYPFDGSGGVLAHAWLPTSGKAHFDDDENWAGPAGNGKSMQQVAVHEFGHVLGLKHSSASRSIMAPYYRRAPEYHIPVLGQDDILGIQSLYGPPPVDTTLAQPTTLSSLPDGACLDKVDAVTCHNGLEKCFVFNGEYCWTVEGAHRQVTDIESIWLLSPTDVDAAVYLPFNKKTFIFKGCYAYQYDEDLNLESRRRNSELLRSLPCTIDAIFYSSKDGLTYAFKNSWVYAYNRSVFYGRIRIENLRWPNMPSELFEGFDAISDVPPGGQLSDNFLYVFKGDHYYMMNRQTNFFSTDSYDVKSEIYPSCA